jgi:hypothetical protein
MRSLLRREAIDVASQAIRFRQQMRVLPPTALADRRR